MGTRLRQMPRHSNSGNFIFSSYTTTQLMFIIGGFCIFGIIALFVILPIMGGLNVGFVLVTGILGILYFVLMTFLLRLTIKKYQDMKAYEVIIKKIFYRAQKNDYILDVHYKEDRSLPDIEHALKVLNKKI